MKSTLAAECLALEDAVDTAYYLKSLLLEMLCIPPENVEIQCFIDNNSLFDIIHSTTNVKEEKRLILDISLIKEMLERKELTSVSFVKSKYQLADCFTKQGARRCDYVKLSVRVVWLTIKNDFVGGTMLLGVWWNEQCCLVDGGTMYVASRQINVALNNIYFGILF